MLFTTMAKVLGRVSPISRTHFFVTCDGAMTRLKVFLPPCAVPKPIEGTQSICTNFRFSTSTFCHNQGRTAALKLALGRFGHSKLCIIKGISSLLLNIAVDVQHFVRQRLGGRVKQGDKLFSDTVGDVIP